MRQIKYCVAIFLYCSVGAVFADSDTEPSLEIGADVFQNRCSLCHGTQGMGEGILAMKMTDYPNTNLLLNKQYVEKNALKNLIIHGGSLEDVSGFMPPWGDELTWTELESVVDFTIFLRANPKQAIEKLAAANVRVVKPSLKVGKDVFMARCTLCHGSEGEGNGRMSRVIKSPPPANLVTSLMPKEYLALIVTEGGERIGRSPQMPPWGEQLSENEINAVVDYIFSLR